jgi:hypothetical protein
LWAESVCAACFSNLKKFGKYLNKRKKEKTNILSSTLTRKLFGDFSWMEDTMSKSAYVKHASEATYSGFEGMGWDNEVYRMVADEGEGYDSMRRTERIMGNDVEAALVNELNGEPEERHGDGECIQASKDKDDRHDSELVRTYCEDGW